MLYLICYDVVQDRRRSRVSKVLEGYGIRVQKSVFECALNADQYAMVQRRLGQLIKAEEDQVRLYPMTETIRRKTVILGQQPNYAIDSTSFIV